MNRKNKFKTIALVIVLVFMVDFVFGSLSALPPVFQRNYQAGVNLTNFIVRNIGVATNNRVLRDFDIDDLKQKIEKFIKNPKTKMFMEKALRGGIVFALLILLLRFQNSKSKNATAKWWRPKIQAEDNNFPDLSESSDTGMGPPSLRKSAFAPAEKPATLLTKNFARTSGDVMLAQDIVLKATPDYFPVINCRNHVGRHQSLEGIVPAMSCDFSDYPPEVNGLRSQLFFNLEI